MTLSERLDLALSLLSVASVSLSVVAGMLIAISIRQGLTYWPALRVVALAFVANQLYRLALLFPFPDPAWHAELAATLPQLMLQVLLLYLAAWSVWLILRQNALAKRGWIDIDGKAHQLGPEEAHRQVAEAIQVALEADPLLQEWADASQLEASAHDAVA